MSDQPIAAFVKALDSSTGKTRTVPAHYLNNPSVFGGVFVTPPADAQDRSPKKSSRRLSAGAVETPATAQEATETNPPQAGETNSEE